MISKMTSRRGFLKTTGWAGLLFVSSNGLLLSSLSSCSTGRFFKEAALIDKYGPLVRDPAGIFDLPAGFTYKIISQREARMDDGLLTPDKPDGMAAYPGQNGRVILMRNHELMPGHFGPFGPDGVLAGQIPKNRIYDWGDGQLICPGGTTTLVLDEETLEVEKIFLSLGGTLHNCSGGPTPWGTWISSEELFMNAGNSIFQKDHGYNFEVPASEEVALVEPVPLKEMGRFRHEAVGVDARTGIVYQTEDLNDGLIYRFVPHQPGHLTKGGRLQALSIKGRVSLDTRNWSFPAFPPEEPLPVKWIDLHQVDSPVDDLRYRGFRQGAAVFARGEGMWFQNNECYFACTNGGSKQLGQIFRYIPSPYEGTPKEKEQPGTLELFFESTHSELVRWCDNLTVAPWGDLVVCEDNQNPYLFGVTPDRKVYKLGRNTGYKSELAGCAFSPSGKTLFVNIQHAGLTLAIQGPWQEEEAAALVEINSNSG